MGDSVKRLAVLGSTGSIGRQTLDVVRALPDRFRVVGLAAGKNIALLAEQINEFRPEFVSYAPGNNEGKEVPAELAGSVRQFISLEDMACHSQADMVVIATSGKMGLAPTLAAVKAGKNVALANKESLVMAGEIIIKEAERSGAQVLPVDSIDVLVHPQSIIHSMVEFIDGSIKAQLSYPDMRLPIQYALSYPERLPNPRLPRVDWSKINSLTFQPPDLAAFPCLGLAIEAGKRGGTCPAALCAADEVAVELFLSRRIGFVDIAEFVGRVLAQHRAIANPTLEEIMAADAWAREKMLKITGGDS